MLALLDTSEDLATCEAELGCFIGQLLTPLTRFQLRDPNRSWAIDNGAYAGFNIAAFRNLLARERHHCNEALFVAVPDVVGSARRTLEVFERWKFHLIGWPLALVCHDGQEDLPIPWDAVAAVFIGGTTKFKCSRAAADIVLAAKMLDKWVHVGRVNHAGRWQHFEELGVDSVDGTGIARYSHMRQAIRDRNHQTALDL